jgi:hypothetical protein
MNNHYYICYEPLDGTYIAEQLCDALNKSNGLPKPWLDIQYSHETEDYQEFIGQIIRNSEGLILLMTPKGMNSNVCRKEWRYALKNLKPIIPVRFDTQTSLPFVLDSLKPIDFSSNFDLGLQELIERHKWIRTDDGIRKTIELAILDAKFELRRPGTDKTMLHDRIKNYELLIANLGSSENSNQTLGLLTKQTFISYSRQDIEAMNELKRILTKHGVPIWYDEKVEQGTENWPKEIQSAIEKAGCVVCMLSPDAKTSDWVSQEIHYAKLHNIRIFPILIRGNDKNAVPIELANYQRTTIDLNDNIEMQLGKFIPSLLIYLQNQKLEFSY